MTTSKLKLGGFTLVEALVAIAILITAVVGPISLIGDATHKLYYSRDRLIALNLAQEGIEVARQKRDSNMLGGVVAWNNGLANGDYTIYGDVSSTSLVFCAAPPCDQKIYSDNITKIYKQNSAGGTVTGFSRNINIFNTVSTPPDELKVTSTVTWTTGGQAGTVTVSEYLFKWAVL